MAAHRYWRLVGFSVPGSGPLELSEFRLYAGGVLADAAATLTCTVAPDSGTLADLRDGLAAGVVSWPPAAHRSPGFALVWDFGAGNEADITRLRLGSGNSAETFPITLTLQYSDGGGYWLTAAAPELGILFPGALALTLDPATGFGAPPTWNPADKGEFCVLSSGDLAATLPVNNGAVRSTVSVSSGKWYWEVSWLAGTLLPIVGVGRANATVTASPSYPGADSNGWSYFGGTSPKKVTGAVQTNYGTAWATEAQVVGVALDMDAGTLTFFKAGVSMGVAFTGLSGEIFAMAGGWTSAGVSGAIANFGASAFAHPPPEGFHPGLRYGTILPLDSAAPKKWAAQGEVLQFLGSAQPSGTASGHLREHTFFDVYHGGLGIIYGTVKESQTPDNLPLRRRVLLIDERSRLTIRETWSDAATGNYEFRGVRQGVPYTVLSYDHTGSYRAVLADMQTPELMA